MTTMKKVSILICFLAMFSFVFLTTAVAKPSDKSKGPKWNESSPSPPENKGPKGPSGPSGRSKIGHLYLYEKMEPAQPYPAGTPWEIVEGGAWGKMKYPLQGPTFKFVFNGHDLTPGVDYTLIYYPDPWPGTGLICLGIGTSDEEGDVHIMGSKDIGNLPIAADLNNPDNGGHADCIANSTCIEGAKIWLVLSSDVDCGTETTDPMMIGWTPTEYLFEDVGIFYVKP